MLFICMMYVVVISIDNGVVSRDELSYCIPIASDTSIASKTRSKLQVFGDVCTITSSKDDNH